MFKSWSKKNKIKTIFKFQFHVTQVPKLKKPAVAISLVPEDAGKPSVKLEKVPVQDGTCVWEHPVFEPVKLIVDNKTGKINEKLYHFIVSTGSSKSGYLGEASIDLSDFVAETEALTVSLPLKFANSGAVLHVTIQRMLGPDDGGSFREDNGIPTRYEDETYNQLTPVEKNATNLASLLGTKPVPRNGAVDTSVANNQVQKRQHTLNWSADSISDDSLMIESPSSIEDEHPGERLKEAWDDESSEKLKNEVTVLMRQAELSELEIQSLRRHIEKETRQGQNLLRQVSSLKEERDKVKLECERVKSLQKSSEEAEAPKRLQAAMKESKVQLEATKQELNHEKRVTDNLQVQLQKTQDSNSELVQVVKDLEDLVERKNRAITDLSSEVEMARKENQRLVEDNARRHNDVEEIELLEAKIGDLHSEMDVYEEEKEKLNECIKQLNSNYDLLNQDNYNLSLRLKRSQEEKLKLENDCERLQEVTKKQAREFSEALISIEELEGQAKALEKQLIKQAKVYEDDLDSMTRTKNEHEQRGIKAEEALKSARLNSSINAERLQEEFRALSVEMSQKDNENEKQAIEAQTEISELRLQNRILEDKLEKMTREIKSIKAQERMKLQELVEKIELKEKQIGKVSLELDSKSQQLECTKKHEEENHKAFLTEIQMFKAEIERLNTEKSNLATVDLTTKKTLREKDGVIQRLNKEKESLEAKCALVKKEVKRESKGASFRVDEPLNMSSLQTEVATLKEKTGSMEKELKEMEERYSEISLRFAEVEGERQKLVMTVRNLKNGKKS